MKTSNCPLLLAKQSEISPCSIFEKSGVKLKRFGYQLYKEYRLAAKKSQEGANIGKNMARNPSIQAWHSDKKHSDFQVDIIQMMDNSQLI